MARRTWSRFSLLVCGALFLIVAWRLQLLRPAPASHRAGTASAPITDAGGAAQRDLDWDEQQGGHTLNRHVGLTTRDLAERLAHEAGIAAASSFLDRTTAERIVGLTLARERTRIASWLRRGKENLTLDYRGKAGQAIGWVLLRGESAPRDASDARVVLRTRGERYFVLTAYPVEP